MMTRGKRSSNRTHTKARNAAEIRHEEKCHTAESQLLDTITAIRTTNILVVKLRKGETSPIPRFSDGNIERRISHCKRNNTNDDSHGDNREENNEEGYILMSVNPRENNLLRAFHVLCVVTTPDQ